ncbi:DUF6175 family protein [Mariniflexile sp. AS56]|uniref:DUF6175 family protein n=1 Tax=Mariniflexile sp. AS56 TaxID=3063957 RepID=UPI0026EFC041|nr:DUF6175 family protein [Mariniflexile sp. AS56]MDO7173627.1 DUF6175 family protein [Mariniflexile sp. AS56]
MKTHIQLNITYCLFFISVLAFAQAKKPTLMVVPSDAWCIKNGYVMNFDDQGTMVQIPDYQKAFQQNTDILLVISQINGMMADRGFPLKNMESTIKTLKSNSAEDNLRSSKDSGSDISESPIDALKKVAKADIIMQLTWSVNSTGPKKSVTFNLQGLDAYTDKQIASAAGTGAPSFSAELPVLLSEAVLTHMDKFTERLQAHFDDMFANGREIIVRVQKWNDWDGDLETEFDGEELGFVIEDWMARNAVKGRFSTTDMTENMALFEQVRMPLESEEGRAIDARRFVNELSKFLKSAPYNIPNKLVMKGLGRATVILGGK